MQNFIKGLVLFNAVGVLGQLGPAISQDDADAIQAQIPETDDITDAITDNIPDTDDIADAITDNISDIQPDAQPADNSDSQPAKDEKLIDTSKASELSCVLYANWAVYDLRELMKVENYEADNDVSFNFCKYAIAPEDVKSKDQTFAYLTDESPQIQLTSDNIVPTDVSYNKDKDWLEITNESRNLCEDDTNYSFKTIIECDESITGQGNGKILDEGSEDCEYYVRVSHAAGCPSTFEFQKFIHDYPWLFAIIMIVGGPLVGLYGKRFFPWVMAGLVFFITGCVCLIIFAVMGWMDSTVGLIICCCIAIALGLLAGWFVKRIIWLCIALLGFFGGFFLGLLVFSMVLALVGDGPAWAMMATGIAFAIGGFFLARKFAKAIVLMATSLIGSYGFMRGVSYFMGGYPNEAEIYADLANGQTEALHESMTNMFWLYIGIFVCGFFFFMYYQINYAEDCEELANDENYKSSDDHFGRYKRTQQQQN